MGAGYGRFCESGYDRSVSATRSNTTTVRFVSLTNSTAADDSPFAISLSWTTVCQRDLKSGEVVRSPGYPDSYPANQSCSFTFDQSSYSSYYDKKLTFTTFNLPYTSNQSCDTDYVQISTSSGSFYDRHFCGSESPPVLEDVYQLEFQSGDLAGAGYGFQATFTKSIRCGQTDRTGTYGDMSFYLSNNDHIAGACAWNITVDGNYTVILMIEYISLNDFEEYEDCEKHYVKIYDGDTATESNLLKRYCGYTGTTTFLESTSNSMLVEFYTNGNATWSSWYARYFAVDGTEDCRTVYLNDFEGSFGIQNSYTHGLRRNGVCVWNLSAEEGSVIVLAIDQYSLRPYDHVNRCNSSVLKIFDGTEEDENHLIRNLCREDYNPRLLISTTNNLLVVLSLQEDTGYALVELSARYRVANASQVTRDCGENVTGTEGTITSPNYPNHYDNLTECTWLITVDPAYTIRFKIQYDFPYNYRYRCASDSLMIWEGHRMTDDPRFSFCSNYGYNNYYQTLSNEALLRFASDWVDTATGFNLRWYTVCETYVNSPNASTLQSPSYPDNYPGNLSCVHTFQMGVGYSVVLTFNAFQLEGPGPDGSCTNDYLEVRYRSDADFPQGLEQNQRFCGDDVPSTLTVYPPVDIRFVTDLQNSSLGYQASYEFIQADCGETFFTGETGTLSSPNYPGLFPTDINCTYVIQVDPGETIYLAFDHLSLGSFWATDDQGQVCDIASGFWQQASLYVFDGEITWTGQGVPGNDSLINIFCGSRAPAPITSTGNVMTLFFSPRYNYDLRGFSATYTAFGESTIFSDCGGEVSGQGGQIVSPNYPEHYPNNSQCVWTVTGWEGDTVRVTFTHLDLEDSSDCQRDSVEFRDGPHETDRRLDRVCGDVIPFDVTSTGNVMSIRFVTDLQNTRPGFNLTWISLCEETFRGSSGTIRSPPLTNGSHECTYIIEQWQSYVVQLDFSHFQLGSDGDNCQNNYLEVRDGGFKGSPLLGERYCGTNLPPLLTSSQNLMWIRYVTDGSDPDASFQATFQKIEPTCGSFVLTEKQGTFTSPQYPNSYPNRMSCSWDIVAETGHVIQLTFDTFLLETSSTCYWDWVAIFDGATRLGKYCGVSGPDQVTSASNRLKVEFVSDWSVTSQGFSASYIAYDPYSDELTRQYDLYPYGEENGDDKLPRRHDKAKKLRLDTGFPVRDQLQTKVFIANKGLVSFGRREKGKQLKLKKNKAMICPYHSDIGAWDSDGGVYYQVYSDNQQVLDKASREIREFTEYRDYTASLVLVVTWDHVAHISSNNATAEQATVQLALISDGRRSFGVVYYKQGQMKWSVLDNQPLIIGVSDGQQQKPAYSVYSDTKEAFTKMDAIKGNTGRYGMWVYPLGDSYSADQQCQDWYTRNLPLKDTRLAAFQRLPECPCNRRFIWGNWRWAYYRAGYDVLCFRMTVGRSRQFAPHGKECCYTWNWWSWSSFGQYISDPPNAGSATAYNPAFWSLLNEYTQEDRQAHDVCCYNTTSERYCNMYYELRPVGECSTKIPFSFSWTWGDPHMQNLDGGEYTFNGLGEYIMIALTSGDETFTLQGRTGLAETESGSITNATVFTAFGAEENGVRVFVGLDPNTNDTLIIYGNNSDYSTAFRDASEDEILVDTETFMLKRSNESLVVTFASEIQLTISIGYKALDISTSLPLQYRNLTKGLLGNFNGVKGDDFVLPSGTTLSPDLTDRQIYEDFGPAWAVTESDSVMRYGPREGPADFAHPEFTPFFLDEVSTETRQAAEDLCGATKVACIYDYVATGSAAIASASGNTANMAEERENVTKNTVPVLTFNGTVNGTSGQTLNFNLQGHDPDTDDVLSYHVVDDADGAVQVNSQTGDVALNLDSNKPMSLSFYAIDSNNVQSPIRDVTIITCSGCANHGTCDFSRTTVSAVSGFLIAECDCDPAWTGDNCEEDYDACEESPCDLHQICTDLTPDQQGGSDVGFMCTGCPEGFHADANDSTRCIDIDECSLQTNCTVLCNNLPGSYSCACHDGYRLSSDDVSCDDINECAERTDGCQQQCVNTEGGFHCQCFHGYTLSSKGTCEANSNATSDLCSTAGCDHGCITTTDINNNTVAQCFCNSGYRLDPANNRSCEDRDECLEGVCSQNCTNTRGSFLCTCYPGHVMSSDQRTCQPCEKLRYGPQCRQQCQCSGRGLDCHPVTGCVCQAGWTGSQCESDVNECREDPDVCGEGKRCVNNNGSYACLCPDGYTDNGDGVCQDINECSEVTTCAELEQCHNTPGSYHCTCNKGYTRVQGQCADIDECSSSSQNQCQQLCGNVPGSFTCRCRYGYRLNVDRTSCSQVADVCAEFEGLGCDHGCSLDDSDRAFCFCEIGFVLGSDLQSCQDEDECALGTANCSANSECVNTEGGYTCRCPIGSQLDNDGLTCLPCPAGTYGENCTKSCACGLGASHCDVITGCVCKSGWTGERCQQDINECDTVQTQEECLAQKAQCVNIQGGYKCSCAPGYENVSNVCQDVNECASSPCEQQCENSPGSYRCLCNLGFSFDATTSTCADIDECTMSVTNECTQRCDNTQGFYRCSCDVTGYVLDNDGVTCSAKSALCNRTDCPTEHGGCSQEECFCNQGYQLSGANACEWIDEDLCASDSCEQNCAESSDGRSVICTCDDGYLLNNDQRTCRECAAGTYGQDCSNTCTCNPENTASCDHVSGTCNCKAGWEGVTCGDDIDECTSSSVTCPAHSACHNTAGSYVCQCETGYVKNSTGHCEECAPSMYGTNCARQCMCTINTESCNHVDGACVCKAGWEGARCESDVDECLSNQHSCSGGHVICVNQNGGFSCGCEGGYKTNGSNICIDVDECFDSRLNNCDQECTNTIGSYNCSCSPGYLGSGNDCRALTRVAMTVTLQITAPSELSNPFGKLYAVWMKMAEQALYDKLKPDVPGLQAVIILSLRLGSLVIDSEAVVNNETHPQSTSDLTLALIDMGQGQLTVGNQTGDVGLSVGGLVVDSSTSACDVYENITACPSGQQCQLQDGSPSCQSVPPGKDDDKVLFIAVGVSVAVVLAAVLIGVAICVNKTHAPKTGPILVTESPNIAPTTTSFAKHSTARGRPMRTVSPSTNSFNSLPSSRKGRWTADF